MINVNAFLRVAPGGSILFLKTYTVKMGGGGSGLTSYWILIKFNHLKKFIDTTHFTIFLQKYKYL